MNRWTDTTERQGASLFDEIDAAEAALEADPDNIELQDELFYLRDVYKERGR
jgi:hypothetical protein